MKFAIFSVFTTFPFNFSVLYVDDFIAVDVLLFTFAYTLTSYSVSCFLPQILNVATPPDTEQFIFIAYFLEFLNLKSLTPYTTVASLPAVTYDGTNWWLWSSTISKFESNTALNNVDDIWQIPPPSPWTTSPFWYTAASLYPAAIVLSPTTLLYENVSPGNNTCPFILWAASLKFVVLSLFEEYLVENVASKSGKASTPVSYTHLTLPTIA